MYLIVSEILWNHSLVQIRKSVGFQTNHSQTLVMKNLRRILQKKKRNKQKAGLPPKDQSRFGKNRHKKPDFTWLSWCVCFEFLRFWVPKLQRTCPLVVNSLRVEMSARHLGRSSEKKKWGWKFRQDPKLVGGWTTQLKKISQNGNLPQ